MQASKAIKLITISSKATEQHTSFKLKTILKWLKAGHDVKVEITEKQGAKRPVESIFDQIRSDVKPAALISQKQVKPESIKFVLKPTKEAANLVIPDKVCEDDDIETLTSDKDLLSEDFNSLLEESIQNERSKKR